MELLRVALCILLATFSSTVLAQNRDWNGTWSGKWGDKSSTLVVIQNDKAVEYVFEDNQQPVGATGISGSTLVFGNDEFQISLRMRDSSSLADAEYKGPMGHLTAVLKRQEEAASRGPSKSAAPGSKQAFR